jgi:hypothetical protein
MVEYVKISLDEHQMLKVKQSAVQQKHYAGRVSLAMALDLLHRYETRQWYWPILDEIDEREGVRKGSRTKPAEQFKKDGPLYPLWHKHLFTPAHMARNIGIRWGLERNGNRDLDHLCETVPLAKLPHAVGVEVTCSELPHNG